MALDQTNDTLMMKIFEALNSDQGNGMRSLLESVLNVSMRIERERAC